MFGENAYQNIATKDFQLETLISLPIGIDILPESEIEILAEKLSPTNPWALRQAAARTFGRSRSPEGLPILLAHLQYDPFWMVRCTIIQVLESIGDCHAIPVLQEVAEKDNFFAVRSAAIKAIERLSKQ